MRDDDLHIGHYVSGAGHLMLIGWLLLGHVFSSDPPPFEMTEVSVISGADFDALIAAQRPPEQATEVAQPAAPEITPDQPAVAAEPDSVIEQPTPLQADPPADDSAPEVTEQSLPPQTEVADTPPELQEPVGEQAVLVPEVAPEAAPRPVPRVAPEPVAQPDPEATPDPVPQEAVAPDAAGEATQEPQEATAPEEATTEIVTEATKAPATSARPPGRRPAAPAPRVADTPAATPSQPASDVDAAAIAAAVAAAQEATQAPAAAAPSGPPLSAGEKETLRVAVSNCWNVDVGARSASTIVTVSVSLDRNGKVLGDVRLLASEGGDDRAVQTAFQAARRAILRCQRDGYQLPAEKFSQWQEIEMTFNPEKMRIK